VDGQVQDLGFRAAALEITRSVCWGPMTADLYAGARYAGVEHRWERGQTRGLGTQVEGVGVTFGLDMRAPLGDTGLSVFANLRSSTLFGHADAERIDDLEDVTFYVAQTLMGLEYRRRWGGGEWKVHVLAEAQSWMAAISPPTIPGGLPDEDVALLGVTLGGQYRY
jgi:hypothetical protein